MGKRKDRMIREKMVSTERKMEWSKRVRTNTWGWHMMRARQTHDLSHACACESVRKYDVWGVVFAPTVGCSRLLSAVRVALLQTHGEDGAILLMLRWSLNGVSSSDFSRCVERDPPILFVSKVLVSCTTTISLCHSRDSSAAFNSRNRPASACVLGTNAVSQWREWL